MTYIPQVNPENYIQIAGLWLSKTNLIQLVAIRSNAGNFATFRRSSDTAGNGYAPSGVTFVPAAIAITSAAATGTTIGFALGYGDNDVGFFSAAAPTNDVYFGGGGSEVNTGFFIVANETSIYPLRDWVVPNGKFPVFNSGLNGNAAAYLYGYQV